MDKPIITQEQINSILQTCYDKAMNGLPGEKTCTELADDYLLKYKSKELAVKKMVDAQLAKCSASGFLTNLGGLITLPVAIPANIASVLYVQIRMIGTIAVIGGWNLTDDEVQTLVYLCLIQTSVTDALKSVGVQFTNKLSVAMLKKIPGSIFIAINKKIGFRMITKFGQKGIINLVKITPVLGGVVGAGFDYATTRSISKKAYKIFILNDFE